jgi:hypothetical protein
MPTRDDVLREKTHKDGTDTIEQRVYYTLHADGNHELQLHRNTKAIALLISHLHQEGQLSDDALDEVLFQCVGG